MRPQKACPSWLLSSYPTLILFYSKDHHTVLGLAFFSVILKWFWNQIWIPQAILNKANPSRSCYKAIFGLTWRFSYHFSYSAAIHQIFPTRNRSITYSDERFSQFYTNVCVIDEILTMNEQWIRVDWFWHFFSRCNLRDFSLTTCLLIVTQNDL